MQICNFFFVHKIYNTAYQTWHITSQVFYQSLLSVPKIFVLGHQDTGSPWNEPITLSASFVRLNECNQQSRWCYQSAFTSRHQGQALFSRLDRSRTLTYLPPKNMMHIYKCDTVRKVGALRTRAPNVKETILRVGFYLQQIKDIF